MNSFYNKCRNPRYKDYHLCRRARKHNTNNRMNRDYYFANNRYN